jgi:outer membrane protein assembly factor BamB
MLAFQRATGSQLLTSLLTLSALFLTGAARGVPDNTPQPSATGWKIKFDESGSSPVLADGVLYVGSADGAVYALDLKTGDTKWRFQTGENLSPAGQIITVPRGTSAGDQMMAGMSAVEKQIAEGTRKIDMTPAVVNGTVFIGSGDHSFYAIDAPTGQKKWSYAAGSGMVSTTLEATTVSTLSMRSPAKGNGYSNHRRKDRPKR